jgi:hypothetical protein
MSDRCPCGRFAEGHTPCPGKPEVIRQMKVSRREALAYLVAKRMTMNGLDPKPSIPVFRVMGEEQLFRELLKYSNIWEPLEVTEGAIRAAGIELEDGLQQQHD